MDVLTIIAEMTAPANYSFSILSIPPLITAAAIFLLGLIVLLRERGSAASIAFAVFTLSITVWLSTIGMTYAAANEPFPKTVKLPPL